MAKLPRILSLTCACCGGEAKGRQWHNRDTGYGVCPNCIDWMKKRSVSANELSSNYGVAGVHYFENKPSAIIK